MNRIQHTLIIVFVLFGKNICYATNGCGSTDAMEINQNINSILSKEWTIEEIQLNGVKIGDPLQCIDHASIVDASQLGLSNVETKIEAEQPLEKKLANVSANGGWIRCSGGYNYRIESGSIVQFGLFLDALDPLNVKHEKDIVGFLGSPDEKNDYQRHGKPAESEYYYSGQKFLLIWSNPFNKLLNINIGTRVSR